MTRTPKSFVAVFIVLFSFRSIAQPPPPGEGWFDALFKDNAPLVTAFATGAAIAGGLVWLIMRQPRRADAPQVHPAVQAAVAGVAAVVGGVGNVAPAGMGGGGSGAQVAVEAAVFRGRDHERIQNLKMCMLELRGVRNQETHQKVLDAMRDMTYEELQEVEKVFQGFWAEVFSAPVSQAIVEAPSAVAQSWQEQRLVRRGSNAVPVVPKAERPDQTKLDYTKVRGSLRQLVETPVTILEKLVKEYAGAQELSDIDSAARAVVCHLQTMNEGDVGEAARNLWFWNSMLSAHNGGGSRFFTALTPEQFAAAMQEFVVKLKPLPEDPSIDDMIATMRFAAFQPGAWTPYMEALCARLLQRIGKAPPNAIAPLAEEIIAINQLVRVEDLKTLWSRVFGRLAPDLFHCYNKLPDTFMKIMAPYFAELARIDERLNENNFIALMKELQGAYGARQKRARALMRECAEPMIKRFMALECAQKTAESLHKEQATGAWYIEKAKKIAEARVAFLASLDDPRMHFLFTDGEQAMVLELSAAIAKRKAAQSGPQAIDRGGPTIEVFDGEDDTEEEEVLLLE